MIMVWSRVDGSIILLRSHGIKLGFDPAVGGVLGVQRRSSSGTLKVQRNSGANLMAGTQTKYEHQGVSVSDHAKRYHNLLESFNLIQAQNNQTTQ